jgi:HTH-type transcriptional regulator/antitoxin HigA
MRRSDQLAVHGNDAGNVIGIWIMNAETIKTDSQHEAALSRIEDIFDARPGTPEGDECERLVHLVEAYEAQHHAIDLPNPIEAIKFRIEQQG